MKIFLKLYCLGALFLLAMPVKAELADSLFLDTTETAITWPSPLTNNGKWSKKAMLYALKHEPYRSYLCLPYQLWIQAKPFVAIDLYDPYTPPEYAIIKIPSNNNLLIFIVLLNVMFVIAIIKLSNERNLLAFVSSLYSNVSAVKYYGDRNTLFNPVNMQLLFVQLLMVSLGISLYKDFPLDLPDATLLRFFILFFILLAAMLIKVLINWSIEKIFEINRLSIIVTNHTIGINFITILVMMPIFLMAYLNEGIHSEHFMAIFVTASIIISLAIRVFRSFLLLNSTFPYPKVYLLLYFCTAEILPWLIIFKLISH